MEITSVNHICFSVSDLNTSIQFYKEQVINQYNFTIILRIH